MLKEKPAAEDRETQCPMHCGTELLLIQGWLEQVKEAPGKTHYRDPSHHLKLPDGIRNSAKSRRGWHGYVPDRFGGISRSSSGPVDAPQVVKVAVLRVSCIQTAASLSLGVDGGLIIILQAPRMTCELMRGSSDPWSLGRP